MLTAGSNRTLKDSADSFPPEFISHKVLPILVNALEFGGASASTILPLVLQLGSVVGPEDHPQLVIGPVVKLFASPDRGTRMALLDHLPEFADKLDQRTVSDKIWPHLVSFQFFSAKGWVSSFPQIVNWLWRYCCSDPRSNCSVH